MNRENDGGRTRLLKIAVKCTDVKAPHLMTYFALIVFVVAVAVPDRGEPDQAAADQKFMQGTWTIVSAKSGSPLPGRQPRQMGVIKIAGNTIESFNAAGESEGVLTFILHPEHNPKQIDVTGSRKGRGDQLFKGIYSLKNGQLRFCWCLIRNGASRPTTFEPIAGKADSRSFVLKK